MNNKRKTYQITCPSCNTTIYACKSIFHEMGMHDLGHGSCPYCKTLMRLKFDPETDTMQAERWEDHAVSDMPKEAKGKNPNDLSRMYAEGSSNRNGQEKYTEGNGYS